MAEDKTKKDLKAEQAEIIAEQAEKQVDKPVTKETGVTATAEGQLDGQQEVTDSKSDTAEVIADQAKDPAKSGTEKIAKAGKRSAKGLKEADEKQAKKERQTEGGEEEADSKPKKPVKPPRSRLERRGKKYQEAAKLIDKEKAYTLKEALQLLPKLSQTKFDATAELHIRLNVDPRQADQNLRDTVVLPAGTGKSVRVAVFAEDDDVTKAIKAGADTAGSDEFLQKLDKGTIDFDVLIATPQMMGRLGKYARVLGPKGLMPNPKSGTVTNDIEKAVSEAKAGRVEYRVDSAGIVHVGFGKVSFGAEKLMQNATALIQSIKANKPSSIKGAYFESLYVTVSMGPSVKIDIADIASL